MPTLGNDILLPPMPAPFTRVGEVQTLGWHRVGEAGLCRTAELVTQLPVARTGHGGDVAVRLRLVNQPGGRPEHEAELFRIDLSPQQARSLAMALEDAADEARLVAAGSALVDSGVGAKGGC
ncbi:MAG: hypothetical protein K2Q20_14970 [Phycisphaerales bacterium]|nr:hypothetical protein [Phycisphaerales bacterium]